MTPDTTIQTMPVWSAECADVAGVPTILVHVPGLSDTITPEQADTLAAQLVKAAAEVRGAKAAEGERSCFTCAWSRRDARVCCKPGDPLVDGVAQYLKESGALRTPAGQPQDRTIPCPGHKAKEPHV